MPFSGITPTPVGTHKGHNVGICHSKYVGILVLIKYYVTYNQSILLYSPGKDVHHGKSGPIAMCHVCLLGI